MPVKSEITFPSRDGASTCHACMWAPKDTPVRGIFQIIHGMVEYIERYDSFARFLASQGFLVVGADHLGHGKTAATDKDLGYFCPHDPETVLVRDAHRLKKIIQEQNPGVPYFILGHSMGSFILRKYITMYGKGIDGAIIIGTGIKPPFVTGMGIFVSNFLRFFYGDRHISGFITKISLGGYNKRIDDLRTPNDWLTRDTEAVDAYNNDPLCSFSFSLNAYRAMFKILGFVCQKKNLVSVPKTLPILILSGSADPVGDYGSGPNTVYRQYKELGIRDLEFKLYDGFRHELLNEIGKDEAWNDISDWLNAHILQYKNS